MNKNIQSLFLLFLFVVVSCTGKSDYGDPDVNVESLQKDFNKWWTYYHDGINLSSDFRAIDYSSNIISKEIFLRSLTSGKYIPVKLIQKDTSIICYQLFRIDKSTSKQIVETVVAASALEYERFKMEGQPFPKFNFTDLNGKLYTNENTKGKIVVLKCWFIKCHACINEFPELNEMVNLYKDRNDIVFVSLAFDQETALKEFLLKKPFSYATVSCPTSYLTGTLKVNMYPTHFVINKDGKIVKIVSTADRLKHALANLAV